MENHVNVLTCNDQDVPLTPHLLVTLLRSRALDRAYRCLSGSVAVSAYELAALPMPEPGVLRAWHGLTAAELEAAIDKLYGLTRERPA